jgi:hypothetical protein
MFMATMRGLLILGRRLLNVKINRWLLEEFVTWSMVSIGKPAQGRRRAKKVAIRLNHDLIQVRGFHS